MYLFMIFIAIALIVIVLFVTNNREIVGKSVGVGESQVGSELSADKVSLVRETKTEFIIGDELDIEPYLDLARQFSVEEIVIVCNNKLHSFTSNKALCLSVLASGQNDPSKKQAICEEITSNLCNDVESGREDCVKNALGHKEFCGLPIWR